MNNIKKEIIKFGAKLYQNKFVVASEGNISLRTETDRIIATKSGVNKGELTINDLVEINRKGQPLKNGGNPSTEILMHLEVYNQRPDTCAIIHAHPPYAISLTLAGISMSGAYLPESVLILGAIPVAPYARPSTPQVPQSIKKLIKQSDIILLDKHGSLTVGRNLQEAYDKLEILENTAKILWLAHQLGPINPISDSEIKALLKLRKKIYGLDYPTIPFNSEEDD